MPSDPKNDRPKGRSTGRRTDWQEIRPADLSATKPRRITAQDVADAAGVSRSAVSRAFSKGAYLDAEKRARIQKVAASLGYRPNALATGLKDGQSNLVAILVGDMRNVYDTEFTSTLVRALNGLKKRPILIDGSGDRAKSAIDDLLRLPLDALILRGGSLSDEIVTQCAYLGIPMISSGRPIEAPHVDNVCCRNADGTRLAAELLLKRGRRRFGFINGPKRFYSSAERLAGLESALSGAGLSAITIVTGDYTVDGGFHAALDMLSKQKLDALICANDAMAIGALAAARQLGLHVPEDLSLVGFDDIAMAKWPMVNLTTIRNPLEESVDQIIDLFQHRTQTPDRPAETRHLVPTLVLRGTH